MNLFKIIIQTLLEGNGAKEAQKELQGVTEESKKSAAALTDIKRVIKEVTGVTLGVGTAIYAARRAWSEYAEAQKGVFGLDAALRHHGNLVESVRVQYQELAGELQKETAIADDTWLGVLTRLTQFGVKPDEMADAVEVVRNLAGVMGGDVRQAAELAARALGGSFDMFRRMGIIIPENATQLEKWNAIAKQAADIGGGQLEAAASGAEGEVRRLKNSIADLFEAFGGLMAESHVLPSFLEALRSGFDLLSGAIGGTIPKADALENVFSRTKLTTREVAEEVENYAKALQAVQDASEKTARSHAAELRAIEALKQAEEQMDRARFDQARKAADTMPPEAAKRLRDVIDQQEKEAGYQRERRFREVGSRIIEQSISDEDNRVKAAEAKVSEADRALKEEDRIDAEFQERIASLQGEVAELTKKKQQSRDEALFIGNAELTPSAIQAQIDAKAEAALKLKQEFESTHRRDAREALTLNAATARKNLEDVRKSAEENKFQLQEELGRTRLEMDTAAGARAIEQGSMARPGVSPFNPHVTGVLQGAVQENTGYLQGFGGEVQGALQQQNAVLRQLASDSRRTKEEIKNLWANIANARN